MPHDLRKRIGQYRDAGPFHKTYGEDYSALPSTAITGGEIKGHYGHTWMDTAAGWVGATANPTSILTATAVNVSGLVSGTHYGIRADANAVELDLDAAPTAGDVLFFTIVNNAFPVTIDVNGGTAFDRSFWGRDLVAPAGTMAGKSFVLRAVSNGTVVRWGTDFEDEQVELPGPVITTNKILGDLEDGITYPINSAGGPINLTLDTKGTAGKHVKFMITDSTNLITIVVGANSYWGVNFPFPAGESAGKTFTLFSDGSNWAMDLSPDMVIPGDIRAKRDNAVLSSGDANDVTLGHDGTNSALTNYTGTMTVKNASSPVTVAGRATSIEGGAGGAATGAGAAAGAGALCQTVGGDGGAATLLDAAAAGGAGQTVGGTGGAASAGAAGASGGAGRTTGGRGGAGSAAQAAGAGADGTLAGGTAGINNGGGGNNGGHGIVNGGAGTGAGANGDVKLGEANTVKIRSMVNHDAEAGLDVSGANLTVAAGLAVQGLGQLEMYAATGAVGAAGSALTLDAGAGGDASGAGAAAGAGANLTLRGGNGGDGLLADAAGAAGYAEVRGGTGGDGTAVVAAAAGSPAYLLGGAAGANGGAGGNDGGNAYVRGGAATGAGTNGAAILGDINTSAVRIPTDNIPFTTGGANDGGFVHDGTDTILSTATGDLALKLSTADGSTNMEIRDSTGAVVGRVDSDGLKQSVSMIFTDLDPFDTDWEITQAGTYALPDSKAAKILLIRMSGLKVGDKITDVRLFGLAEGDGLGAGHYWFVQGDGAGGETAFCSVTKQAGSPAVITEHKFLVADETHDHDLAIDISLTPAAAVTVAEDTMYFVRVLATTEAGAGIGIMGVEVTLNRVF
jgi:hypothetical protein